MSMRNGDDQNVAAFDCINDPVGKPAQSAAAGVLAESMPGFRMPLDKLNGLECFDQERVTQAGRLFGVLIDRLVQLRLCRREEAKRH